MNTPLKHPEERDWRTRRAEYLARNGRYAELLAEGLEHFADRAAIRRWRDRQALDLRRAAEKRRRSA